MMGAWKSSVAFQWKLTNSYLSMTQYKWYNEAMITSHSLLSQAVCWLGVGKTKHKSVCRINCVQHSTYTLHCLSPSHFKNSICIHSFLYFLAEGSFQERPWINLLSTTKKSFIKHLAEKKVKLKDLSFGARWTISKRYWFFRNSRIWCKPRAVLAQSILINSFEITSQHIYGSRC